MSRFASLCLMLWAAMVVAADEPVGQRPYEMTWVNRTQDTHPPLLDFENLDGWQVECRQAEARFTLSREQQLWGAHVGKLVYRGTGTSPLVTLRPPQPLPLKPPYDCVNFWVYGNNWAWVTDRSTPPVTITVVLQTADNRRVSVALGSVRWKEWWVMHRRLTPEQLAMVNAGATLVAIEIAGGRNAEDRVLYFDNLAVYREALPPLAFEPRPKRGIEPFAGQGVGTNTGPGRLPFPAREETILPDNLTADFRVTLEEKPAKAGTDGALSTPAAMYEFHYRGRDGHLVYRYQPQTGTLGDVLVQWADDPPVTPMSGGGLYLAAGETAEPLPIEKAELVKCSRDGPTVTSTWKTRGDKPIEFSYTFRLWQKSLVIDVRCLGGEVGEVRFGRAVGVPHPRLVTLPYLPCDARRPAVLVSGPVATPRFLTGFVDHCRSNASALFALNDVANEGVVYNGGARYLTRTDGRRNDCFERLFLTVAPRFEEVLPNVPNPKSPWMHVTGQRVWRAHGASKRDADAATWRRVARHGMTEVLVTDHETGWRDGGESFTLRTQAAPGKGGDAGQEDYGRTMHGFGFRYGIYNNYTDFAPVNAHWDEDWVTRLSNGDWRPAWARCYNLKPSRAVEAEARLAPIIQQKFHLDTAYCDVHTAVTPWQYTDFDARVPGGGTFAATFYAYGEIMLHQKRTWNGPVYSEGNNHWYYCGLTDGNYGQDQSARLRENPWLVDFDLRKLHPLCCNFGMGNLGMFYGKETGLGSTPQQRDANLDRFLAATLAFGHTGFLVMEGGMASAARSYFALQQVHARYAQATAVDIRYADADGRLWDTSAAVARDIFRRSQVVTRYSNGLEVFVNGHPTEVWRVGDVELPSNGWMVKAPPGEPLVAFSRTVDGHRADYVDSPAYIYADGRGHFTRFAKAATDGQLIALHRDGGGFELIPVGNVKTLAVSLEGRAGEAVALDEAGQPIATAETRLARGLVHVTPVPKAFSYLLKPSGAPVAKAAAASPSARDCLVPGESIVLQPGQPPVSAPAGAQPGQRLWFQSGDAWYDFTVVPLVDADLTLDGHARLRLMPHVPAELPAEIRLADQPRSVRLAPRQPLVLDFDLPAATREEVRPVELQVAAGPLSYRRTWWLKSEAAIVPLAELPAEFRSGQCSRLRPEQPLDAQTGASVARRETSCGGVSQAALFMHPPYRGGVGYSFAVFGPLDLPGKTPAAFRCEVGKADGSDRGDGILFRVAVVEPGGKSTVVAEKTCVEHAWSPLEADLAPWAGKSIQLKLIADVGPKENSSGDWAAWAKLRVESRGEQLQTTLHDQRVALCYEDGPQTRPVAADELRSARGGMLHFEGIGIGHSPPYISTATLNKVPLGDLPATAGSEIKNVWAAGKIPLPAAALAALTLSNQVTIANPGRDSFKLRRMWLDVELADGTHRATRIDARTYTQPDSWKYAEGIGVPFDQPIEIGLPFLAPGR